MAIRTIGGFEVEVLETEPEGREFSALIGNMDSTYPKLKLRRVVDGLIYPAWERAGIIADGGDGEIRTALAEVRARTSAVGATTGEDK